MLQNRWRSKVLWSAIAGQMVTLAVLLNIPQRLGIDVGVADEVIACVIQLLVLFGVLNNPTDSDKF